MKRLAHGLRKVMFAGDVPHNHGVFFFINAREHAVIRREKILILPAHQQGPALRAYPRIDNNDVNCARREIGIRRSNRQRTLEQIEWGNVVGNINDLRVGIDLQDRALYYAH